MPTGKTRVLVANRGEIAVRIFRTCRELDIPTVAVYSDADREALHVDLADEAYRLGPASPTESYLNAERILDAARRSRATLIHPGYGFLAENADFARAVREAGLTFVGPPPEAMAELGDKMAARRTAERAGAPIVPGTLGPVSPDQARREAKRIGFPLVVKAAFGGGGKGMRVVERREELQEAVERSAREATAYFGRPEVYLERYIATAHHVEAQILADAHGAISFLGERDCSLQRRNQKLVEESPSPVVDEALRTRIGEAAMAIAREAGYTNAGTVEFLLADDGSFSFMEVNARLQVEHPVTEMVTGLDLVKLQILVALGEHVAVSPSLRGNAIECRLNAEDAARDFLPGPGLITRMRAPGGPFVRLDSGVEEGREVVGNYDSLIGKLIASGEDREAARRRILRALGELEIEGIPTTAAFHRWVLKTDEFVAGSHTTRFVETALAAGRFQPEPATDVAGTKPADLHHPAHGHAPAGSDHAAHDGSRPVRMTVEVDGRRVPVLLWGPEIAHSPPPPPAATGAHGAGSASIIAAPMQGTILQVMVEPGQEIVAGDVVCILEAMKMENHIAAAHDGVVREVAVKQGDVVQSGETLISLG